MQGLTTSEVNVIAVSPVGIPLKVYSFPTGPLKERPEPAKLLAVIPVALPSNLKVAVTIADPGQTN